jgi:hypothetical protein
MSQRDFSDVMREAFAAIVANLKRAPEEIAAELDRQAMHGSLEFAQGLFNGSAFTPYGPGAYPVALAGKEDQDREMQEREHDGREM